MNAKVSAEYALLNHDVLDILGQKIGYPTVTILEFTTPPGYLDLAVLTSNVQQITLAVVRMTTQQAHALGEMLIEEAS